MSFETSGPPSDKTARFQLLYDLGCAFAARIEPEELFPLVVAKCREVFDCTGASVLLLDAASGELYFPFVADDDPGVRERLRDLRFPADLGIAGSVLRSGTAVRIDDVQADSRFFATIDRATGFRTQTLLCAPLTTRQGVIGVIEVLNRHGGLPFTDDDLTFLEALAGSVAAAVENARLYAGVKASEDVLRAQVGALRRDQARRDRFSEMIGSSREMTEVFRMMESAAASSITVLVEGETGTGKELVARGIHAGGRRAEAPFIAVNCAAVSEHLLESELFGHRRGAFTGATEDHRGLFEAATGGTIFFDEIGDMPVSMQAKLLRVLQEGEIVPVGDTRPRKVDVRVISATNRDLQAEVERHNFREDLFYRLSAFPIQVPPLRRRREDIPLLADRILGRAVDRQKKQIRGIEPTVLDRLVDYDWPGNVRELENELERAVVLAGDGDAIASEHLSSKLVAAGRQRTIDTARLEAEPTPALDSTYPEPQATSTAPTAPLRHACAEFEAKYIRKALDEHNRNVSHTARALGLSRVTLQKKMKEYGLRPSPPGKGQMPAS